MASKRRKLVHAKLDGTLGEYPVLPDVPEDYRKPKSFVQQVIRGAKLPVTHNVVVTGRLTFPIVDPRAAAWNLFGHRNRSGFAAPVNCRLSDPSFTLTTLRSGKLICKAAKSLEVSCMAMHLLAERLSNIMGIPLQVYNVSVENILCTFYLRYHVDMNAIARTLASASYHPENIRHAKFQLACRRYKSTMLIYHTGKIVLTGMVDKEHFVEVAKIMIEFLAHFATHPEKGGRDDDDDDDDEAIEDGLLDDDD